MTWLNAVDEINQEQAEPARPYSPEQLRDVLIRESAGSAVGAWDGLHGACVGALDNLFRAAGQSRAAATQKRHLLLEYLFGKKSSKDLTGAEARALLAWASVATTLVNGTGETYWAPDEMAQREAEMVVSLALANSGQQPLF